jgi:hypothetical protein
MEAVSSTRKRREGKKRSARSFSNGPTINGRCTEGGRPHRTCAVSSPEARLVAGFTESSSLWSRGGCSARSAFVC